MSSNPSMPMARASGLVERLARLLAPTAHKAAEERRASGSFPVVNLNKLSEATQVEQLISQLRKYPAVHTPQQRAALVHLLNLIATDVNNTAKNPLAGLITPSFVDNHALRRQANSEYEASRSLSLIQSGRLEEINTYRPTNLLGGAMSMGQMVLMDQQRQSTVAPSKREPPPQLLPEKTILRDLLYVLQGIDGAHIKYDKSVDRFQVDQKGRFAVSRHQAIAISTIAELGWLFKRINDELAELSGKSASGVIGGGLYIGSGQTGLVEQSFREGIQSELRAYWRMIAILRGLIENPENAPAKNESGPMTLLRLVQYVGEPMRRLKWLAIAMSLPEKPRDPNPDARIPISNKPPPPLPNRLQQLSLLVGHGDPFVRSLGRMLEEYALRPIVTMIEQWCFQGQLVDPYGEFFIEKNKEISSKRRIAEVGMALRDDPTYWEWDKQYLLKRDKIPPFISAKLAHRILVVGKSINFLRQCCDDSDWVLQMLKKVTPPLQSSQNWHVQNAKQGGVVSNDTVASASGTAQLDAVRGRISEAAIQVGERLRKLMLSKYDVLGHCETLKRYMFLGQGDLVEHLIESLGQELNKDFHVVYVHNLRPILDSAIRNTSVTHWAEHLLESLDVALRTPEDVKKTDKKDCHTGWDIFELDFRPAKPLDAVLFTEEIMRKYRRMSRFLWRLRLAQARLSNSWRLLQQLAKMRLVHDDLRDMLHQCNTLRTEMTHFLCNFQYYIMFEVLETGYMDFSSRILGTAAAGSKMKPCNDMDDIIEAHSLYLQYILRASLLEDPTKPNDERPPTLTLILSMLDAIEKFDALVVDIFEQSELISNRRHAAQRRSKKGGWGKTDQDEAADEEFRQNLRNQLGPVLTQMHQAYWKRFGMLFKLVKAAATVGVAGVVEDHDNNMRQHLTHLAFRLDFNQFYTRSIDLRDAASGKVGPSDLSTPAKRS